MFPVLMKLITWNVAQGNATDVAVKLANAQSADVLLLQEARRSQWGAGGGWSPVDGRPWGSAVRTREGSFEARAVPGFSGWVFGGHVMPGGDSGDRGVFIFSLHSPTSNADERRRSYVAEATAAVRQIVSDLPRDADLVIGGDFNFKSFGERGAEEAVRNEKTELDALRVYREELGFTVAWCEVHPGVPLPQTLRWTGDKSKPFHCDGFLVRSRHWRIANCDVLTDQTYCAASDHSPVMLELEAGGVR